MGAQRRQERPQEVVPKASASFDRFRENVLVHPIVVVELKFTDVQQQVCATHFVITAHDAALQTRPEAGMDRTHSIMGVLERVKAT